MTFLSLLHQLKVIKRDCSDLSDLFLVGTSSEEFDSSKKWLFHCNFRVRLSLSSAREKIHTLHCNTSRSSMFCTVPRLGTRSRGCPFAYKGQRGPNCWRKNPCPLVPADVPREVILAEVLLAKDRLQELLAELKETPSITTEEAFRNLEMVEFDIIEAHDRLGIALPDWFEDCKQRAAMERLVLSGKVRLVRSDILSEKRLAKQCKARFLPERKLNREIVQLCASVSTKILVQSGPISS